MPREGTRSATGNSKPRVFQTVDTAPAIKRTTKPRAKKSPTDTAAPATAAAKPAAKVKAAKPTGVTKKKAAAPKKEGVATKVCHYLFQSTAFGMSSTLPVCSVAFPWSPYTDRIGYCCSMSSLYSSLFSMRIAIIYHGPRFCQLLFHQSNIFTSS